MPQLRLLLRRIQVGAHQLIDAIDLADAKPAAAVQIQQAVRQLPVAIARQLQRRHQRLRPVVPQQRQPPVLSPQGSVGDPHQQQRFAIHAAAQHAAAVVVHPAAQADRGRGEFSRTQLRSAEGADQGRGASFFLRALFQPDQPDSLIRPLEELWLLEARKLADGDRCRKGGRSHTNWIEPITMLYQRWGGLGREFCAAGPSG